MKRVVIYGFVVVLLAVLAGCDGGNNNGGTGTKIANVPSNLGFDQPKSLK